MRNRQPTYPGRVKLISVDGEANTFDLIRADEPTDPGTPLNKNTLLTDQTAATMGLDSEATPNEMFAQMQYLSNNYVWHRIASDIVYTVSESEPVSHEISSNGNSSNINDFAYSGRSFGTGYVLNKDGSLSLTGVFTPEKKPNYSNLSYWDSIILVYMKVDDTLYRITEQNSGGSNFMYYKATQFIVTEHEAGEDLGYVNSPAPTAYPPEEDDGITYELLGRVGKGMSRVKVVYGSYTGDGAKTRTFEFDGKPVLMIIEGSSYSQSAIKQIYIRDASFSAPLGSASESYVHSLTWNEKSVTASASDYFYYINYAGRKFNYVALVEVSD